MEINIYKFEEYSMAFWDKVNVKIGDSWEWKGTTHSHNYGLVSRGNGTISVSETDNNNISIVSRYERLIIP